MITSISFAGTTGRMALLAIAFCMLSCFAPSALADTTDCVVINAVPYTVPGPGKYCLGTNLTFAGTAAKPKAIAITNLQRVTIDCNGYSITDATADPAIVTYGIHMHGGIATIQNCTLNNFNRGMQLSGHALRIEGNSLVGSRAMGLYLSGGAMSVRHNRIADTVGCYPMYLMSASRSLGVVQGNHIRGSSCATATGIYLIAGARMMLADNKIEGLGVAGGRSYGIFVTQNFTGNVPALIERNHFFAMKSATNTAIAKTTASTKSRCSGNVIVGSWTANSGCL